MESKSNPAGYIPAKAARKESNNNEEDIIKAK